MPYRTPTSFYAARRLKLSGKVYLRGDEIPADVMAKMRKADSLLTYGYIVADRDPWERKGPITTPNPTALNVGTRRRLAGGVSETDETDYSAVDTVTINTVQDVLEWVGDDKDRAQQAWDAEVERDKPRSTLVKALESILGIEDEK